MKLPGGAEMDNKYAADPAAAGRLRKDTSSPGPILGGSAFTY